MKATILTDRRAVLAFVCRWPPRKRTALRGRSVRPSPLSMQRRLRERVCARDFQKYAICGNRCTFSSRPIGCVFMVSLANHQVGEKLIFTVQTRAVEPDARWYSVVKAQWLARVDEQRRLT